MRHIELNTAASLVYDVVVVGAGVAGSVVAKQLAEQGYSVLLTEAGLAHDLTIEGFQSSLNHFYRQTSKDNNAPYRYNLNAESPRTTDVRRFRPRGANDVGYFVHAGSLATDSTYLRSTGGSTMHWRACTPRMIPDDFKLHTLFGQGRDWPITYDDLEPYYQKAELEMGVAGDVATQDFHGTRFAPGYVFPMEAIPTSYLDKLVARGVDGTQVECDGETFTIKLRPTSQARNGVPNAAYDGGKGFRPVAVTSKHQWNFGQRCQGNANCIPICPVQAKYDARRSLFSIAPTRHVDFLAQTVASRVELDPESGKVAAIHCKTYESPDSPAHVEGRVRGRLFVLAANAIENAKLMLASNLPSSSGLIGKNLMDHAYSLSWALLPEPAGTMRGPQSTSGFDDLRSGKFRRHRAAFRQEVENLGWAWATGSPFTDLLEFVDTKDLFGAELRTAMRDRVSNQLLFTFMTEQLPEESNTVSVDDRYRDQLGNHRPILTYDISEYTKAGVVYGRKLAQRMFERLGAKDCTVYHETDFGFFEYEGGGYSIVGGNHFAGTHLMGTRKDNSAVNKHQKCWDFENLYLVGAGSSVSIGTSNPTLTLTALAFLASESMLRDLKSM